VADNTGTYLVENNLIDKCFGVVFVNDTVLHLRELGTGAPVDIFAIMIPDDELAGFKTWISY
jgi:hypothetical protein